MTVMPPRGTDLKAIELGKSRKKAVRIPCDSAKKRRKKAEAAVRKAVAVLRSQIHCMEAKFFRAVAESTRSVVNPNENRRIHCEVVGLIAAEAKFNPEI